MIKLDKISKTYPHQAQQVIALHEVSLHVPRATIRGIIGKSGAGKSSLIRCVNLIEKPDSGHIIVDGVELQRLSAAQLRAQRRKIGMIFQQPNLLSSATVYENIALPLALVGASTKHIKQKVAVLLQLTDLIDKASNYPAQLSGGQQQRVAIARALANDPTVLLCDEATSALDPETTQAILRLLKSLNQQLGLTILLITHEIEVIKTICDDVSVIEQGRIVEDSDILSLFTKPQTAISKNLIRGALKLDLPTSLQQALHIEKTSQRGYPLLSIKFIGQQTNEPLIANLAIKCNLNFSILQANIELIHEKTIGVMIMAAYGDDLKVHTAIDYLSAQGLQVEIIGYVND